MDSQTERRAAILWYADSINAEFERLGYGPITDDQIECLSDPSRYVESLNMVDDWESRLGLSGYWRGELCAYLTDQETEA